MRRGTTLKVGRMGGLIAVLFCSAVLSVGLEPAHGEDIQWHRSYAKALEEAKETNRPILVNVSAKWCGYCTQMERTTLSDEGVAHEVTENFVPLMLDADRDRDLISKLRVSSFPTTIIVAPDRTILRRINGYQDKTQFTASLRNVLRVR